MSKLGSLANIDAEVVQRRHRQDDVEAMPCEDRLRYDFAVGSKVALSKVRWGQADRKKRVESSVLMSSRDALA